MSRRCRDERGSAALVTVLAMAITLVVFMGAINLIVDEYGTGAVRTAVDEATRAGSVQGAPGGPIAACQAKAAEVMGGLLSGPFGAHVTITCGLQGDQVTAMAIGSLPGWLQVIPADSLRVVATAPLERNPTPGS